MVAAAKKESEKEQTLGALLAHPLRSRCLTILAERIASPNELSQELGAPLGTVSYHVTTLHKAGAVELVSEAPRRGAVEHYFRAVVQPCLDDEAFARLAPEKRSEFARQAFQLAMADASVALEAGTMGLRWDYHATRVPMVVDEPGWKELGLLFNETLEKVQAIKEACGARLRDGGVSIPVTAFSAFFEVPPPRRRPKEGS